MEPVEKLLYVVIVLVAINLIITLFKKGEEYFAVTRVGVANAVDASVKKDEKKEEKKENKSALTSGFKKATTPSPK